MSEPHPRMAAALEAQLARWRSALRAGADRIGWKLAYDIPEIQEVVGNEPVIGHLTSASVLEDGGAHSAAGARELRAETEVAVEVGPDGRIAGFAVALEMVDVDPPQHDLEGIVAANVFHRAVALGPTQPALPRGATGRLVVNGQLRGSAATGEDYAPLVFAVARQLGALGESLLAGERILTGAVVRTPVQPGDRARAEIEHLGAVELAVAS